MDFQDVHHSFDIMYFSDTLNVRTIYVNMALPVDEVNACRIRQEHSFDFRIVRVLVVKLNKR